LETKDKDAICELYEIHHENEELVKIGIFRIDKKACLSFLKKSNAG
jgi:hypothetical protein